MTTIVSELLDSELMMESCQSPQSLVTCVSSYSPVQLENTEDLRKWLQAGSPVSHTAEAESNSRETTIETCGLQPLASLAKCSQSGAYWKTYQESLIPDMYGESLPIWPRAVMWDLQHIYRRLDLAQITRGIESGLSPSVPTCSKSEYKGAAAKRFVGSPHYRGAKMSEGLRHNASDPAYLHPDYAEAAMMWPITWTALAPLGMDKFQQWLEQCGTY